MGGDFPANTGVDHLDLHVGMIFLEDSFELGRPGCLVAGNLTTERRRCAQASDANGAGRLLRLNFFPAESERIYFDPNISAFDLDAGSRDIHAEVRVTDHQAIAQAARAAILEPGP